MPLFNSVVTILGACPKGALMNREKPRDMTAKLRNKVNICEEMDVAVNLGFYITSVL